VLEVDFSPNNAELRTLTGTTPGDATCPSGEMLVISGVARFTLQQGVDYTAELSLFLTSADLLQGWLNSGDGSVELSELSGVYEALSTDYPCEFGTRDSLAPSLLGVGFDGFTEERTLGSGETSFSMDTICSDPDRVSRNRFLVGSAEF